MLLSRFGASSASHGNSHIVVGGVVKNTLLPRCRDILVVTFTETNITVKSLVFNANNVPAPLIIGADIVVSGDENITLIGGGATCFSMGAFWTPGTYSFRIDGITKNLHSNPNRTGDSINHLGTKQPVLQRRVRCRTEGLTDALLSPTQIKRAKITTKEEFHRILLSRKPVILEGLDIGSCVQKWDLNYLLDSVGKERKVP